MKSYKKVLNDLANENNLRKLSEDENRKLRQTFLTAFQDIVKVCEKNNITVMLTGGSALGAVRHHGFIPWDDDMDIAMSRSDFERFKCLFKKELASEYMLSSPNYEGLVLNRFPQVLIKGTKFVGIESVGISGPCCIAIDIFIIENVPDNKLLRIIKGIFCQGLMFIGSRVQSYEQKNSILRKYMYKTVEGKKLYNKRLWVGKLFAVIPSKKWFDWIDKACRYEKETNYMGTPTGRKHYFGEIRKHSTFVPASKGTFEGIEVNLPGNPQDYLSNLYGDYMNVPPIEQREQHFIYEIEFN